MCEVEKGMNTAKEVYGYVDSIKLEWDTVPSTVDDDVPEEAVMMSMQGRPSCVRAHPHSPPPPTKDDDDEEDDDEEKKIALSKVLTPCSYHALHIQLFHFCLSYISLTFPCLLLLLRPTAYSSLLYHLYCTKGGQPNNSGRH